MINGKRTFEDFGYNSAILTHGSSKKVWRTCDCCGKDNVVIFNQCADLCRSCAAKGRRHSDESKRKMSKSKSGKNNPMFGTTGENSPNFGKIFSDESKRKMSEANLGENNSMYGKHHSKETKNKISENHTDMSGEKNPNYGKTHSYESRRKISAAHQNISYDEWKVFAVNQSYCPRFNESCKESNRNKYGRQCFICGLPEKDNITLTGKYKKLSVHHVDMQKQQGCNGYAWKLIPVCMHCHMKLHNVRMASCIEYILEKDE